MSGSLTTSGDIAQDEACEGEAEHSGDVAGGAVDLGFGATPFVLHEALVAWGIINGRVGASLATEQFCLGAYALGCATGALLTSIGLGQFVAIYAEELFAWHELALSHTFAHDSGEGVVAYFPELGTLDGEGVGAQGGAHRGEEGDAVEGGGVEDELYLVLEGVDGIDDVVIVLEVEVVLGVGTVYLLQSGDLSLGVDVEQSLAQGFNLYLANGLAGCHDLTVAVGDADAVGIDDGEMLNA